MSKSASEVLLIKQMLDSEVEQYRRMILPASFREDLIEQATAFRLKQAKNVLECFIQRYDETIKQRRA